MRYNLQNVEFELSRFEFFVYSVSESDSKTVIWSKLQTVIWSGDNHGGIFEFALVRIDNKKFKKIKLFNK